MIWARLTLLAAGLLALDLLNEFRTGRAEVARSRSGEVAFRVTEPERYGNLMIYQLYRGIVVLAASGFIYGIVRHQERIDPLSPDFAAEEAIADLEGSLDDWR